MDVSSSFKTATEMRRILGLRCPRYDKARAERRFALGAITGVLGISEITVRNWLTRGQLQLSSNEGRGEGKHRRFSIRDAIVLMVAFQLSRLGVPPAHFAGIADEVADFASIYFGGRPGMMRQPMLTVFNDDGEWKSLIQPATNLNIPPAAIVVDVERIIKNTLDRLY